MKPLLRAVKNSHLASYTDPVGFGASEVFEEQSLRAVKAASGYIDAATDGATEILGFVDFTGTTGSSDGDDSCPIENSCLVSYEAPYDDGTDKGAALTQATLNELIGTTCGISVDSDIQYADIGNTTAAQQVLVITGGVPGAAGEAILHVAMNPNLKGKSEAAEL